MLIDEKYSKRVIFYAVFVCTVFFGKPDEILQPITDEHEKFQEIFENKVQEIPVGIK